MILRDEDGKGVIYTLENRKEWVAIAKHAKVNFGALDNKKLSNKKRRRSSL